MTRVFIKNVLLSTLALALPLGASSSLAGDVTANGPAAVGAATVSPIEQRFSEAWVAADPEVYTRIAMAFDSAAMNGADLMAVECRATLCRLSYRADSDIPVRKLLPVQLAESFRAMVTVHQGQDQQLYLDVPEIYRPGTSIAQAH